MKALVSIAAIFVASLGAASAQNAPFCVFSGAGAQCFYWDAGSCQAAARSMEGMCAPNQQGQQVSPQPRVVQQAPVPINSPSFQLPDMTRQAREAEDAGRRRVYEEREHRARMAALEAQAAQQPPVRNVWADLAQAAEGAIQRDNEAKARGDNFRCKDGGGNVYYAANPTRGCVYIGD